MIQLSTEKLTTIRASSGHHGRGACNFMGNAVRSENATARGRKINWVHWGWSLTQWYCGTRFYAGSTELDTR